MELLQKALAFRYTPTLGMAISRVFARQLAHPRCSFFRLQKLEIRSCAFDSGQAGQRNLSSRVVGESGKEYVRKEVLRAWPRDPRLNIYRAECVLDPHFSVHSSKLIPTVQLPRTTIRRQARVGILRPTFSRAVKGICWHPVPSHARGSQRGSTHLDI